MRIYTTAPISTPWLEVVSGNQGLESKPRAEHIEDEWKRVHLFDYLKVRETGNLF